MMGSLIVAMTLVVFVCNAGKLLCYDAFSVLFRNRIDQNWEMLDIYFLLFCCVSN